MVSLRSRIIGRRRRGAFVLAAGVLLALAAGACAGRASSDEDDEREGPSGDAVAEVTVTRVARSDVQRMLSVSATVSALPNRDVRVGTLVGGRIATLTVAEGDEVRAGQLLARIDDRPYRDELEQADAALARTRAEAENARLALAREEGLLDRGISARKDFEEARTQADVRAAEVRQAEAAASVARRQLERTEIRSPLAGRVVRRFVSVGEQVEASSAQPVVEVADPSEIELIANIPSDELVRLRTGDAIDVSTSGAAGAGRSGVVAGISPAVDPATNTGVARIRVRNGDGHFRLGMFLEIRIPAETRRGVLTAPLGAVYRGADGRPRVYRVEGDLATAVPVALGIEAAGRVELVSGVAEGDTLILDGGYGLGDTGRVRVAAPTAP